MQFVRQFNKYAMAESHLLKQFPTYFLVFDGTEAISNL
jgi:hypothetical protein